MLLEVSGPAAMTCGRDLCGSSDDLPDLEKLSKENDGSGPFRRLSTGLSTRSGALGEAGHPGR